MTLVVGLPLVDKSKGSSWNAPSLLMDLLLKSIGVLIGLLVIEEPVPASVTIISPLSEGAGSQTGTPEISSTLVSSGNTGQTSVPVLDLSSRQASTPVTGMLPRY
jgi:hypothetical protein